MTFLYVIVSFTGNDQAYLKILVEMIHLVGRPATVGRPTTVGRLATVTVGRPNVVGRPTTQSWATSDNFFSARSFLSKSDGADRTRLFLSDLHRLWPRFPRQPSL